MRVQRVLSTIVRKIVCKQRKKRGEGTHDPGAPADLAVEALNDVVRADPRPVCRWEIAVG